MRHLNSKQLKAQGIVHIILIAGWVGTQVSMLALVLLAHGVPIDQTLGLWAAILLLDRLLPAFAGLVIVTGLIFGLFTPWGFFKARWITVKWALLIVQAFILGFLVTGLPLRENFAMLEKSVAGALANPAFARNLNVATYALVAQVMVFVFLITISRLKPWRRRRAQAGRSPETISG